MFKKMRKVATILLLICGEVFAQQKSTFTDSRDGKKYKTVKIGEQTWMAENLNYNAKGSKCYDNKPANCQKYGRLYDWATAMNIDAKFNEEEYGGSDEKDRGICPSGWHIPSEGDWDALMTAVGSNTAGTKLKATAGWNSNGNGTDEFGFSALPGGFGYSDGDFNDVGDYGYWWSATEDYSIYAYLRDMGYRYSDVSSSSYMSTLFSVRCVQD